ncbi:hypothetical protein [uncultured Zhongshania sp.]|uniref:hypothetical protein n=3 Tax=Zhongshania TaxID=1434050 RepID=UPI0030DCA7DC|tara:strand:+ start:8375 stop:11071 length:2697 start_codon:yes stop_codon:yes gene_type:complete
MKTKILALSLTLAASLLVACGGGGDARSPDRPGLTIDPTTLRMEFVDNISTLPGTGNGSRISVRMLALRTDGIEKNVGPELVITDQVNWQLSSNLGSPKKAELDVNTDGSPKFRNAGRDGKVQDILNRVQMSTNDATINATVTATFTQSGKTYTASNAPLSFTIVPPIADGSPKIVGKPEILLDPLTGDSKVENYKLVQYFTNAPTPENITDTVYICSLNTNLATVSQQQPVAKNASVPVTFINPFSSNGNNTERTVKLFAVDKAVGGCDGATPDGNGVRELEVKLKPATFTKVDICAVINPGPEACGDDGVLNEGLISSCKGLNSAAISVPAEQRLQLVGRKTFNDQNNPEKTILRFQCSDDSRDVWSIESGDLIYSSQDGAPKLDSVGGFATTVDRQTYEQLKALGGDALKSVVKGNFGNNVPELTDTLELNLVSARVEGLKIERIDGQNNDTNGPDTLYINSFLDGIEYRALCKFKDVGAFEACPNGLVKWTFSNPVTALPVPDNTVNTTLTAQENAIAGDFDLTLTYTGGDEPFSVQRIINAVDPGEFKELRMFMVPNDNEPETLKVDEFACVGRDDLITTLEDGEQFVRGGQQFEAYALFEDIGGGNETTPQAWLDDPNSAESKLVRVTNESKVRFSAIPGFWSGDYQDPAGCQTAVIDAVPLQDITDATGGAVLTPATAAASFDENKKGRLKANGLLRLSTVCVQAEVDTTNDVPPTKSVDGSTILVLPVTDDDLFNFSNDLCEILEPVLTLGSIPGAGFETPGILLPVIYGVSLVADPLLATLISNDDGGVIPAEAIIEALITGNFTGLSPDAPDLGVGLGTLTSLLLGGSDPVPGLGALVDVVDACLLDPVTSVVGTLLGGILGLDQEAFSEFGNITFDECTNLFDGLAP